MAHPHREPLASAELHLAALAAAGFTEINLPWRALQTALLMARAP